jgi:DHA1 family 2-module integral membrane pump EmrD-like MFS transporter
MKTSQTTTKRIIIFCFLMAAFTQAGLVLYTSAFLQVSQQFQVTSSSVEFTLTAYLFGFGFSQLFYGILSDRFGRKRLIVIGLVIFSVACFWSILAQSYVGFLLSRIVQGLGMGSCMVLGRAVVRDCFTGKDFVRAVTYLSSGFAFGLGVTPVIGGQLLDFFSWRADFVFLLICSLGLLISVLWLLPETHQKIDRTISFTGFCQQTTRNILLILKMKSFLYCLIGGVAAYGIVIAYNTMTPFLFQKTLGYSPSAYGWLTFIIAAVYYISTSSTRFFLRTFKSHTLIKAGIALMLIAGVTMLLGRVIFNTLNLYVIFIPMMIATFAQALIWSMSIAVALKDLSHMAGTAASLFSFIQMLLSALLSGVIAIPSESSQIPLAVVVISLAVIAWISFKFSIFKAET